MAKRKKAEVKAPEVPECEKLRLINEQGHNKMLGDFLTFVQGLLRLLTSDGVRASHWLEVAELEVDELLAHLEHSGEFEWDSAVIETFWEWLLSNEPTTMILDIRIEDTLYRYFGIDREKLETERRELLATCRASNALHDARADLGLED
jgi:hypothetical protein